MGAYVKELNKSDNQFGSLDPEKIYFVEKFGYLIKKINGGYGGPVQNVLFDRISGAVSEFKTDLPNIVHDLEIKRLKEISNRNTKKVNAGNRKSVSKAEGSSKTDIITKKISEKIHEIEKTIAEKSKAEIQKISVRPKVKQNVIEKEIDIFVDDLDDSKQTSTFPKKSSSILRPSVATIREEKRLTTIKTKPFQKGNINTISVSRKPIVKPKPKPKPVQELTEWERKWHKYDGDIVGEDFNGYS